MPPDYANLERRNLRYCAYASRSLLHASIPPEFQRRNIDHTYTKWWQNFAEQRTNWHHWYCVCWPQCRQGEFHNLDFHSLEHTMSGYSRKDNSTLTHCYHDNITILSFTHLHLYHGRAHDTFCKLRVRRGKVARPPIAQRQDNHERRRFNARWKTSDHLASCDAQRSPVT